MTDHMKENQIDNFIGQLHSRYEVDLEFVKKILISFLDDDFRQMLSYMNDAFFIRDQNLFAFLRSSINQGTKYDDQLRKYIYDFLAEYIAQYSENLTEYISQIFKILYSCFNIQTSARPKQFALKPLINIVKNFDAKTILSEKVISPDQLHNSLVNRLKTQKIVPSVKGLIWLLISTIQGKFGPHIEIQRKREVQSICLFDLKHLINQNKNFSTIAALLKSLERSLQEVFLNEEEVKELYKVVVTLTVPLGQGQRYQVSINALQLLSEKAGLFANQIMEHGKQIFINLCGLLSQPNKKFLFYLNETINNVTKQIVKGIQQNYVLYEPLYQYVIQKSWNLLQMTSDYQIRGDEKQKQKFKYNIVTSLQILGIISPLVKHFQTERDLKNYFSTILTKCSKKIKRFFESYEDHSGEEQYEKEENSFKSRKKMHIKFILYNQKQLISFISSLSQIIQNINSLDESEQNQLVKVIMISIEYYPTFFENYLPNLMDVLVQIFKVLQIKSATSFHHLLKKIISSGFKVLLDTKVSKINSDQDYYSMIRKAIKLWVDLINNQNWSASALFTFGNILFQFLQTMIEHLDISYKSNLQIQIQQNSNILEEPKFFPENKNQIEQREEIAKTFFLSSQNMKMSNIEEFRYMHSLVLAFEGILSGIENFNYIPRFVQFYGKVIERMRVFPKSVSLMKVIRGLNSYLVNVSSVVTGDTVIKNKHSQNQSNKNYKINSAQLNEYCLIAKKLYIQTIQHYLQKHQEECLYECLKMLTSFPVQVYMYDNCEILKTNFPYIIKRSFEIGQQIITLANTAIDCMKRLFKASRPVSEKYLIQVLPKMERFIWLSGKGDQAFELESSKKIYLFVQQLNVSKQLISRKIMDFLGSIGGLAHLLVDNSSLNLVSLDCQYPLEIDVLMGNLKCTLNLSKLLNRICFLALNAQLNIKKTACEFLHSIMTLVIGNAAEYKASKQMTANFLDRVFPTILQIASNSSHPSQQLIHTILIQSIRFFSLTQQPNSADISAILKHLLQLYNGTEDMSCLGSKSIAQLVRWHIKSDARKSDRKNYPIIKVIMRNIWTLASNKKARDGLILLLVQLLRQIHRQQYLMKQYALEICSIIINIGRSNEPIEKEFNYLVHKLVLSLNKVIKSLIIEDKREGDQYKKYPTIHKFLEYIYENNFFSIYSQQRQIAFILWKQLITKYSQILNYNCLDFLRNKADRSKLYLFAKIQKPLENFQQKQLLPKNLSKLVAFSDIWKKMLQFNINSAQNLVCFKDLQQIVIQSYVNFTNYLINEFSQYPKEQRYLNQQSQKHFIMAIKSFPMLLNQFKKRNEGKGIFLRERLYHLMVSKNKSKIQFKKYIIFLLKFMIKPSKIVPNFNHDIIEDNPYQKNQTLIKNKLLLNNKIDIFSPENSTETSFCQVMLSYIMNLSIHEELSQDLMSLFFQVIEEIYYCKQEKLIKFLFFQKQQNDDEIYGFSYQFIQQHERSNKGSYIYEKQARMILKQIQILSRYYPSNHPKIARIIKEMINLLRNEENMPKQKKQMIISAILGFSSYEIVEQCLSQVLIEYEGNYTRYQKYFNTFVLDNFHIFAQLIFCILQKQPKTIKVFYFLQAKLSGQNLVRLNSLWINKIPTLVKMDKKTEGDYYRLNYFFAESVASIQNENYFISYLAQLIKEGLMKNKNSDIHLLAINLGSIVLKRLKQCLIQNQYINHQLKKTFDQALSSISTFYIPFTLGQLKKEDEIFKAQKYLKAVEKIVYLSDDFSYCQYCFVAFRDKNLKGKLREFHDSIIDSIVSKYYNLKENGEQLKFAEWVLGFYQNIQYNNKNDPWNNFRLSIIERFFIKMIHFTKKDVLIRLFHKYTPKLLGIINEIVSPKNVEDMVTEFQIKQAAFIIISHLYMYLPKPEKDKSEDKIHIHEFHKRIIARIVEVLKKTFDNSSMILMTQYDKTSLSDKKSLTMFRNYMCAAYNCLIIIFISTQSKVDHFKKYLFEKGEVLWQHLVDPNQTKFQFPIQTDFKQMKPIETLGKFQFKNQRQAIRKKVRNQYMQSSLYAIDEEVPQSLNPNDQDEEQNKREKSEVEGRIEKVLNVQIEEDYINRHPCMVNMLRVIDYMYQQFYDGSTPSWMKPIYDELIQDEIPLSVRIFLTKLILNRSQIFSQATMWGQCILKYLCQKDNGGQFIHYYYRDALLLLIKYLKNGFKPKAQDINLVLMKLVRCLPHDKNINIYSSNVDILQQIMKLVPNIYIDRDTIFKMLTSNCTKKPGIQTEKDKQTLKKNIQWKVCSCIIMKSCLLFKVPILKQDQWKKGQGNDPQKKISFFSECINKKVLQLVEQLLFQTNKRYRVAASGLLGEILRFYNQKDPSYVVAENDRQMLTSQIKQIVSNVYGREQNRSNKEKLSLLISFLVSRYPMVLSDQKIFGIVDTVVVRYKQYGRYQLIEAVLTYLNELKNMDEKSYGFSVEFMNTIRSEIKKFVNDDQNVYKITLKIIKQYAKPFFLENKQIFLAIYGIFETLNKNYSQSVNESICVDFYQIVFSIKDYINSLSDQTLEHKEYLVQQLIDDYKNKIKQSLVSGLGSQFNIVRKIILEHFESSQDHKSSFQSWIIDFLKEIYTPNNENLWMVNCVPLIFSIAKQSSNYNTFLFNKQIEHSALFYDVDFKNISFHNSSQPYTPSYSFFTEIQKPQKISERPENSFIASIGSNRMGQMIRATQNSYMSQQEQVFTMLGSQSEIDPSLGSQVFDSQIIELQKQSSQKQIEEGLRNYANLNSIFMNNHTKKYPKEAKPSINYVKFDSKVKVVGDKIRFNPKQKEGYASQAFRPNKFKSNKKQQTQNLEKIHSSYRSYKVGEMPNVQISLAHVLEPLVEICCFDKEVSSQFLTIFLIELVSKSKDAQKNTTEWFVNLLKNSKLCDFSFISTLQKCLISICQMGDSIIKLNMNEIAIKSNTIDYAIVFTEENLIKHSKIQREKERAHILIEDDQKEMFLKSQWADLIDLYQKISSHAFLPPLLKHITKTSEYEKLIQILQFKQSGFISESYNELEELLKTTQNSRLSDFLERQKIDCLALLGQWEPVSDSLEKKLRSKEIPDQQKRLLTLSLINSSKANKLEILQNISFPDDNFQYQKGLIEIVKGNIDMAQYHSRKAIDHFYRFFKKTTSFDYNSKHLLLENIQKVYEIREYIQIFRRKDPYLVDILNVMEKWAKRIPNEMYDSNLTWIQLLQSRMLYTKNLDERFVIPKQNIAKANTDYMIQVIHQMLQKNIYDCAAVITRKALASMKESNIFNWAFYEALSNLKLFQYKKKVIINPKMYQQIPKIILKQLTENNKTDSYSDIKYFSIENQHLEGFLESCTKAMMCEVKPNIQDMYQKINKIYINYQKIKKAYKNMQKQNQIQIEQMDIERIQWKIHFSFSIFLQKILELTKGRHQIKQISDLMEKSNLPLQRLNQNFVSELIESISLMKIHGSQIKQSGKMNTKNQQRSNSMIFNYKQKELNKNKLFSMILKLLKTIQIEKKRVGKIFSEAIIDKKIPIWIFVYFIPQIIKALNSHEMVEYFADLFDLIIKMYPQALVYHFNCYYEKQSECITDPAKQIFAELHSKLPVHFKFIEALELLYHPEKRLKQILEGFLRPGQDEATLSELEEFINIEHKRLGKYNKKFIEQHKPYIRKIINLKKQKRSENAAGTEVDRLIKMLDPKNKDAQMKDFSKISDGSLFFEDYNSNDWNRIEVPATIYSKFEEPLSWNRVFIESFDLSILTLKSQRKPKRITLYGSNEKRYMFLVKGGEDVRLDQRIQEMFNIMNKLLKNDPQCAKKKLQIKRFQVIPIKKMLGIFEWIDDTQTLKDVLEKELKKIQPNYNLANKNRAFQEYTQKVRASAKGPVRQNSQLYKEFLCLPEKQIVSNLLNCESYMPFGLLRKTLLRLSKSYDFYLHIKNQFLSNYAVVCIVGYILGIGDRHLENFLIHTSSASVIIIDFGYSFGSSRDLAVPQLIPFRLTKSIMEIMEPIGYQGIFMETMTNTFSALQNNKNIIIDFCDVFIDDPLMEWIWKCKRQNPSLPINSENLSVTISQDPPQRKIYLKRIEFVEKKLIGQHPRKILIQELSQSKHKHAEFIRQFKLAIWKNSKTKQQKRKDILPANEIADELITLASDKNILGRCYIGLNPFV